MILMRKLRPKGQVSHLGFDSGPTPQGLDNTYLASECLLCASQDAEHVHHPWEAAVTPKTA